jgi:hypothetical protein
MTRATMPTWVYVKLRVFIKVGYSTGKKLAHSSTVRWPRATKKTIEVKRENMDVLRSDKLTKGAGFKPAPTGLSVYSRVG